MNIRLMTWLFGLTVVFGIVGFSDLADHAADIARTLCIVFGLVFIGVVAWTRRSAGAETVNTPSDYSRHSEEGSHTEPRPYG